MILDQELMRTREDYVSEYSSHFEEEIVCSENRSKPIGIGFGGRGVAEIRRHKWPARLVFEQHQR